MRICVQQLADKPSKPGGISRRLSVSKAAADRDRHRGRSAPRSTPRRDAHANSRAVRAYAHAVTSSGHKQSNLTVSTAGKSAQERSEWDDRFMRRVWLRLSSSSRAEA